jgi:hypothetical protein
MSLTAFFLTRFIKNLFAPDANENLLDKHEISRYPRGRYYKLVTDDWEIEIMVRTKRLSPRSQGKPKTKEGGIWPF